MLGPAYCNDLAIDDDSGLAFLACDPFKPSFYPPYGLHNASRVYGDGGIWLFDTNVCFSPFLLLILGANIHADQITFQGRRTSYKWFSPNINNDLSIE